MGVEIDPKTGSPVVKGAPDMFTAPGNATTGPAAGHHTDEAHKGQTSDLVSNAVPQPNASLPAKPDSQVTRQPAPVQKSRAELDRDAETERVDKLKQNLKTRIDARQSRLDKLEKSITLSRGRLDQIQQIIKDSGTDSMGQAKAMRRIEELLNPALTPLTKAEVKELDELSEIFNDEEREMNAEQAARFAELDTRMELNKLNSIKQ